MIKKLLIAVLMVFFLASCSGGKVKIDMTWPTEGPDPAKLQPTNDPVS